MNSMDELCPEPNKVIPQFVLRKCPCLCTSIYSDGNESMDECSMYIDSKCRDIIDCSIKEAVYILTTIKDDKISNILESLGYEE